ncbi:MAG: hypothetical protein CMC55_06550 [Flavobacteriaceae bacterium]|nr:hypothetical protein [Flavobacteriaceae bacterium]|tara:strand:- start:94 stop:795 length:702 start_codon:yes stop_codon:yes gene_type:complete
MSGLEMVMTIAPASCLIGFAGCCKFLNNKRIYKNEKKGIYKYIRDAINALDFDDITTGFEKLKQFDIRHSNIEGKPNRKIIEKMTFRTRLSKCEKTDILFGIPNGVIDDINEIKNHFVSQMKNEDLVKQQLKSVEEEEEKENETLAQLKKKIKCIKTRQLAENNSNRRIIDDLNLTDIINNLHREYETLFIRTFEEEQDLHNILHRSVKKQMIIKKMNLLKEKQNKDVNLKCC